MESAIPSYMKPYGVCYVQSAKVLYTFLFEFYYILLICVFQEPIQGLASVSDLGNTRTSKSSWNLAHKRKLTPLEAMLKQREKEL